MESTRHGPREDPQLPSDKERAEQIAGMARRVRENRDGPGCTSTGAGSGTINEALKDIAARREQERSTGDTSGEEARKSWQERLAAAQQKQAAAPNDFAEKLARIRIAREEQGRGGSAA